MSCLVDTYHRRIDYMRISVTDRCNLNCSYCTDGPEQHLKRSEILSYEEIVRVVRAAAVLGVHKVRLTGGEPLLRPGLETLVKLIASVPGIDDVSLTTNGLLLLGKTSRLKEAGLRRLNVSLDTFKPERFKRISGSNRLPEVLAGIEAAKKAELVPVKINMVVLKGFNDDEVLDFARKSRDDGWHVRYIEHMPVLEQGFDSSCLVTGHEVMEKIENELGPLEPVFTANGSGPADYYRLSGAPGTIGFIKPMSERFCDRCNRFRLTADGRLRTCLLSNGEIDIRTALRGGASISELAMIIQQAVNEKPEKHHLLASPLAGRQMKQIGG